MTDRFPLRCSQRSRGFTLIELLIVVVILGVMAGLATLSLPDKSAQHWTDKLSRLTATLNYGQEEALSRGSPIWVSLDQNGWRFSLRDRFEKLQPLTHPEIFEPTAWDMPINIKPVTLRLGDDAYPETAVIEIQGVSQHAVIERDRFGRYRLQLE